MRANHFSRRSPHGEHGLKCCRTRQGNEPAASLPARGAWIEIRRLYRHLRRVVRSLPARGAWIEIGSCWRWLAWRSGRSPHGEHGLKFKWSEYDIPAEKSLPARGAWIEIYLSWPVRGASGRRSPHGERGLKYAALCGAGAGPRRSPHGEHGLKSVSAGTNMPVMSRSPHGERGLKYVLYYRQPVDDASLPARGAWIEIPGWPHSTAAGPSLPARGAWIEMLRLMW